MVDAIVPDAKCAELPQTQVQYCEAARPSTFVVGPGNHRRWEIMLLEGDSLSPDFPEEELWPLLSRWIQPGEAKLWRAAAYRFRGLVAREWRKGRILLAGDAAHMTPPFMAQGMVSGMRDAHNLAWKLARVVRREASPALLDSYMQERMPHVRQTILTAMGLGRIICERDAARALERDARLRAAHGGEVRTEYRQNMIPNLQHGLIAAPEDLGGQLFPQPFVRAEGFEGRLDDLTGAVVRVVVASGLTPVEEAAYLGALAPLGGVLVRMGEAPPVGATPGATFCVQETPPLLGLWLAERGKTAVVVRPDHYVYGAAATHAGALALLQALAAACGVGQAPA